MKIGGIDPSSLPNEEILVLPRGEQNIVFRAQGVPDLDAFHAMVPEPIVPVKLTAKGVEPDVTEPGYQNVRAEYLKRRMAYLVVASLKDVEWDTVNLDDPGSWANWEKDLKAAGLSQFEQNLVFQLVLCANSLDDAKLAKARDVFLRGPAQKKAQ